MDTKSYTITVHKGNFGNYRRDHNIRKNRLIKKEIEKDVRIYGEPHIKENLINKDIILCDKDPVKIYTHIFDSPRAELGGKSIIEEWNEKQERNRHQELQHKNGAAYYKDLERKYRESANSKRLNINKANRATSPVIELIIQFGNYDVRPDEKVAEKMYRQFYDDFKTKYGKYFEVCGAYIHFDEEGGHHMHFDIIPVAERESNRGMFKRISFEIASRQALELPKNYVSRNAAEAPTFKMCERLREDIEAIYKKEGFEAERYVAQGKKHLATPQFKMQKRIETLELNINEYMTKFNSLREKYEKLKKMEKEKVQSIREKENLLEEIENTHSSLNEAREKLLVFSNDIVRTASAQGYEEMASEVSEKRKLIKETEIPTRANIDNIIERQKNAIKNKKTR